MHSQFMSVRQTDSYYTTAFKLTGAVAIQNLGGAANITKPLSLATRPSQRRWPGAECISSYIFEFLSSIRAKPAVDWAPIPPSVGMCHQFSARFPLSWGLQPCSKSGVFRLKGQGLHDALHIYRATASCATQSSSLVDYA